MNSLSIDPTQTLDPSSLQLFWSQISDLTPKNLHGQDIIEADSFQMCSLGYLQNVRIEHILNLQSKCTDA